jgi:hypothetical protein
MDRYDMLVTVVITANSDYGDYGTSVIPKVCSFIRKVERIADNGKSGRPWRVVLYPLADIPELVEQHSAGGKRGDEEE